MVVNEIRPAKRVKRTRVTADVPDFLAFPSAVPAEEPFRRAVGSFLSRHARVPFPPSLFPSLMTWQILLRLGEVVDGTDMAPVVLALDIVEEDVTRSRSVYCDHCRVVGWSGHPVCNKRYHFIIRAEDGGSEGYEKSCSRCGSALLLSESRCKGCSYVITTDDIEEWVYSQLENNSHLLHGVVHSNGYGHLLRVNGREGRSKFLTGRDIMDFWDRLCRTLAVRKVSVMDVSKKYDVEYRVLHAVTKGHSWYGDWGYEFGRGSYGITVDAYRKAVDTLSGIPLKTFLFQGRGARTRLQAVIAFYQSLSEAELVTLRDMFVFLLSLISQSQKSLAPKGLSKEAKPSASNVLCAWTRDDVERVQEAMVKVLLAAASQGRWVTQRAIKGAMCKVASPELLDYCLKHLVGKLVDNGMVVRARCSPDSSASEFRLEPLSSTNSNVALEPNYPTAEHIICDLRFLYASLLHPDSVVKYGPEGTRRLAVDAANKLLDCKQFMKSYEHSNVTFRSPYRIWCHVVLSDQLMCDPTPPPELLILPVNATVGDLRSEATKAFQEMYAMFRRLRIGEILEFGHVEDSITLKLLIGASQSVKVRGKCPLNHGLHRFRMERGTEDWTVDCTCGAKDDDGERMLACDSCEVWQHTRCAGIDNSDDIPAKFICERCVNSRYNEADKVPDISKYDPSLPLMREQNMERPRVNGAEKVPDISNYNPRLPLMRELSMESPGVKGELSMESPREHLIGGLFSEETSDSSEDSTLTIESCNYKNKRVRYSSDEGARVSLTRKRCRDEAMTTGTSTKVESIYRPR